MGSVTAIDPVSTRAVLTLRLDNGYCKHRAEVVYFTGKGPTLKADCKPNEVEVPRDLRNGLAAGAD